ncbi:upstream activation factor subunit spp27-like [Olea europaea subsp. europaea]|uniref:Upstream activation factor subunit spp27-like n=1 Tax=Olea europaea subsp. europaea TaxID=158383 RepID=A0A8S0U3F7_OLEEU|nr:upstream activation factor subunit spp27-like [Olea europaea subsp. europaea]
MNSLNPSPLHLRTSKPATTVSHHNHGTAVEVEATTIISHSSTNLALENVQESSNCSASTGDDEPFFDLPDLSPEASSWQLDGADIGFQLEDPFLWEWRCAILYINRSKHFKARSIQRATVRTVTLAVASKPAAETKKREPRGITKPHRVSPEMQAFLGGVTEIPHTQALKEIWAYIKKHNLQDPADKKVIICDEKLSWKMVFQQDVSYSS